MNPNNNRLYNDLAWAWPIISPPEDYVEETHFLTRVIKEYSRIDVNSLLHLGCGGGHNDYTFKTFFSVTGCDTSDNMLELARTLNPEITYVKGDMRSVRLEKSFDAVVIYDAIDYMTTPEDLKRAFQTAYTHLRPGGVFLTVVEDLPERFIQNKTEFSIRSQDDIEIVFIENKYDPDPSDTTFEYTFVYLIRRHGNLEIHTDRHICGIFTLDTWITLLEETGFDVTQQKFEHSTFAEGESYPLMVSIKPVMD
ncbi:MAG: class I SAM-dependent methyltransferase [Theionarchaea archaeon]|nr:class I SAM-dependent methyltransferase [Theionarchaea archaeon]